MLFYAMVTLAFFAVWLILMGFVSLATDRFGYAGAWWAAAMSLLIPVTHATTAPRAFLTGNFVALGASVLFWIYDHATRPMKGDAR